MIGRPRRILHEDIKFLKNETYKEYFISFTVIPLAKIGNKVIETAVSWSINRLHSSGIEKTKAIAFTSAKKKINKYIRTGYT